MEASSTKTEAKLLWKEYMNMFCKSSSQTHSISCQTKVQQCRFKRRRIAKLENDPCHAYNESLMFMSSYQSYCRICIHQNPKSSEYYSINSMQQSGSVYLKYSLATGLFMLTLTHVHYSSGDTRSHRDSNWIYIHMIHIENPVP